MFGFIIYVLMYCNLLLYMYDIVDNLAYEIP